MWRSLKTLLALAVVLLCIGGPVALALHIQAQTRNFHVVKEGVLYRSGQITLPGLKNLIHEYRIRTVVSLRDVDVAGDPKALLREEKYCADEEINYVTILPRPWEAPGGVGPAPVEAGVQKFREVMADPHNYPVLVHCFAGIHRTGAYCAIYRMECEHWSNDRAIDEMKAMGYTTLNGDKDILGYLTNYKPAWKGKED